MNPTNAEPHTARAKLAVKKIVVPVAFDETSEESFEVAVGLARSFGASIHAVHAVHAVEPPVVSPSVVFGAETMMIPSEVERDSRDKLNEIVQRQSALGVPIESSVRIGDPARVIEDVVREQGADLVVIGTHGRRGLARAFLGSVAEKVVRTSPVAVLTIPHHRT